MKGPEYWNTLQRVSYVWLKERWVPYPFQNNICSLPLEDQITCINGLIESKVIDADEILICGFLMYNLFYNSRRSQTLLLGILLQILISGLFV